MTGGPPRPPRLFRRLLAQARPHAGAVAALAALGLAGAPLALLTPVPMKVALDHVLGDVPAPPWLAAVVPDAVLASDGALLLTAALAVVAIAFVQQAQGFGVALLQARTDERLVLGFRARIFAHVQRLALGFHDLRGTADTLYRVQYDALAVRDGVTQGAVPLVTSAATVAVMVGVSVAIDWQLTVAALAIAPVLLVLSQAVKGRLRRQWTHRKELEAAAMGVVQEALGALRVVKAFGQERREVERFRVHAEAGVGARVRAEATQAGFNLLLHTAVAAGTAVVLYLGVQHVRSGLITTGELVLVLLYLALLYVPLQTLGMKAAALQTAFASAARAFALLDEAPEVDQAADARPLGRAGGAVAFEDVAFGYPGGGPVFEGVTVEVPAGARVGVVGPTGAGKSTLLGLLPRLYDPTAGRVLLDGTDLRDLRLADLRRQFAIVLQDPVLFSGSVAENVAYGRPDATAAEVREAARLANAHDFVEALPGGYDAPVGDRGMRLSGGERQRVSLARAFLRDAPVLLLDEPTSAVDVATERLVMDAVERLMEGRTTFMISHRPDTLDRCDLVLRVGGGGVEVLEGAAAGRALPAYAAP